MPIIVGCNNEPGLTTTYFTKRSNLVKKMKTVDFSETIAACDLKAGRCRQLIELIKYCEY